MPRRTSNVVCICQLSCIALLIFFTDFCLRYFFHVHRDPSKLLQYGTITLPYGLVLSHFVRRLILGLQRSITLGQFSALTLVPSTAIVLVSAFAQPATCDPWNLGLLLIAHSFLFAGWGIIWGNVSLKLGR